jgi:hypothetical protein
MRACPETRARRPGAGSASRSSRSLSTSHRGRSGPRWRQPRPAPGSHSTRYPYFTIGLDHNRQLSARIQHGIRKRREITGMIRVNRTRERAASLGSGTARLRGQR